MKRRLHLYPDDREVLLDIYRRYRIPMDQFRLRPDKLEELVSDFNSLTDHMYRPGEVLRYMVKERKQGKWHTFDGDHLKLASPRDDLLSADEWVVLGEIYTTIGVPSDELAFEDDLVEEFERRFVQRIGRFVAGRTLFALLMKKRKRGVLPRLREKGAGFADIDEVARAHAADLRNRTSG